MSGVVRAAHGQAQSHRRCGRWHGDGAVHRQWKERGIHSAVAKATADSFDPSKKGYTLVLSDVKGFPDKYGSLDKVTAGTLHYIELTLGNDKSVYGAMLHHSGFKNGQMSSAGNIKLEVEKFGPDVLAGKVYTAAPRTFERSYLPVHGHVPRRPSRRQK